MRGKYPHTELVGTVVEVSRPSCLPGTWGGNTVVAWDDLESGESYFSAEWMVVLLPEDYGAGM